MANVCEKHWQQVLDDPEAIPLYFSVLLMHKLTEDERFMRLCGYDPATGKPARTDLMNAGLIAVGYICCFLGDATTQQLIKASRNAPPSILRIHNELKARNAAKQS